MSATSAKRWWRAPRVLCPVHVCGSPKTCPGSIFVLLKAIWFPQRSAFPTSWTPHPVFYHGLFSPLEEAQWEQVGGRLKSQSILCLLNCKKYFFYPQRWCSEFLFLMQKFHSITYKGAKGWMEEEKENQHICLHFSKSRVRVTKYRIDFKIYSEIPFLGCGFTYSSPHWKK